MVRCLVHFASSDCPELRQDWKTFVSHVLHWHHHFFYQTTIPSHTHSHWRGVFVIGLHLKQLYGLAALELRLELAGTMRKYLPSTTKHCTHTHKHQHKSDALARKEEARVAIIRPFTSIGLFCLCVRSTMFETNCTIDN